MNFIHRILISFICIISVAHAAGEPLNVGVENYNPPFVTQGGNQEIYGYDIEMMNYICKSINRTCKFQPMRFDELLLAVASKKVDVAIASITITQERLKTVSFSIPYLLSYSRFLTLSTNVPQGEFSYNLLDGKKIGIEAGTVYGDELTRMNIRNPTVIEYPRTEELLEGLTKNQIDYALLDNAAAIYWETNSSGAFKMLGKPYLYGFGCGIAINQSEPNLIQAINKALLQYQNSAEFKRDYNNYMVQF